MTPEEYERLKEAEKEHLKKLKELKNAVRVLERQKKIQSELEKMSRASDDVLKAQSDAVERLAMETALQEARLDVAMESAPDAPPDDELLENELRSARAQTLVERLKQSMLAEDTPDESGPMGEPGGDGDRNDEAADEAAAANEGGATNEASTANDASPADEARTANQAGNDTRTANAARAANDTRATSESGSASKTSAKTDGDRAAPKDTAPEARPEKTIGRM